MTIKIYHGAPGSFKTASAVWYDLIDFLNEGRKVYTNVRNVADKRVIEVLLNKQFPTTAEVIPIDTDSEQSRFNLAAWFHWLPHGAAIVMDEAQFIYDSRYKPEHYDYPGGVDKAFSDGFPPDIKTAVDKHRHYNWDLVLTTPEQKKLPTWLLQTVETCYHHKNMEHVPFFGRRRSRVVAHNSGSAPPSINSKTPVEWRKIPVKVHQIYGSTATGEFKKNVGEKNPFRNVKLVVVLCLSFIAFGISAFIFTASNDDSAQTISSVNQNISQNNNPDSLHVDNENADSVDNDSVDVKNNRQNAKNNIMSYLPDDTRIVISGIIAKHDSDNNPVYSESRIIFKIFQDSQHTMTITNKWFYERGLSVHIYGPCSATIDSPDGFSLDVYCAVRRPVVASASSSPTAGVSVSPDSVSPSSGAIGAVVDAVN